MGRGLFLADRNSHSDHIANLALWGTAVLEGHNAQFAANLRLGAARLPLWHSHCRPRAEKRLGADAADTFAGRPRNEPFVHLQLHQVSIWRMGSAPQT